MSRGWGWDGGEGGWRVTDGSVASRVVRRGGRKKKRTAWEKRRGRADYFKDGM